MRRRLTAAIVGVVAGSLLLAGLGTFLLVRRAARDEARRELVGQAQQLASAGGGSRANVINLLRRVARLQDGVEIGIGPFGGIVGRLPAGLTGGDVDPSALLLGDTVSGRRGSLVFAAAPLALPPPQALVFDQPTKCACKPLDVPSVRRIAVDAVMNEIGHTSHFAADHDRKAGAHGFVHGKPPGFVLRGQHEYV